MLQMGERDKVAWMPPPQKKKGCQAGNITHFFIVRATLHFIEWSKWWSLRVQQGSLNYSSPSEIELYIVYVGYKLYVEGKLMAKITVLAEDNALSSAQ